MTEFDLTPPSSAQRDAIIAGLTAKEHDVLLEHGTEAAFCGVFLDNHKDGVYTCRFCGLPLFRSSAKFDGRGPPEGRVPAQIEPNDASVTIRPRSREPGSIIVNAMGARGAEFDLGAPTNQNSCRSQYRSSATTDRPTGAQDSPEDASRRQGRAGKVFRAHRGDCGSPCRSTIAKVPPLKTEIRVTRISTQPGLRQMRDANVRS